MREVLYVKEFRAFFSENGEAVCTEINDDPSKGGKFLKADAHPLKGIFHGFFQESFRNGDSYPCALIEEANGQIYNAKYNQIKFIHPQSAC